MSAQSSHAGQRPVVGRDLTTGSIPRHLIAFSLPMLAGTALQTAYSFINAIWVGRFLGKQSLAAIAVSFPVVFVLIAIGAGMTLATNIQVSQHYGARDMASVRRVVNNSTILIAIFSLVLVVVGEFFTPAILRAMDTPPTVYPLACDYMRIFLLSLPLGFGLFLTRSMLQGIGDSTTPLYFQSAAVVLTALLDPVLMFGWLGAPKLGLNGTAWATLIAQAFGLTALVATLRARRSPVAPRLGFRDFDAATQWTTIRIGLPSAVQQSLVSVGMVFVIGMVNGFGEDASAAFGAASRVDQLAFMPAMTIGMAVATLAGQNIGAGHYHRIREILLWGCVLGGSLTLAGSVLAITIPRFLLRIFTTDPVVIEMGATYLRIVGMGYVFFSIMFVSNGIINGAGHTLVTTAVTLITLWVVRVPVAYALSRHLHRVDGVWWAMAVSFIVAMATSLTYYSTGRWRRPVLRRRIPPTPAAMFGEESGEA
ncbi:MAG: MATE family efflux transporter [Phycisphaerae bacterium]|nr:MATE family efflux transporter [Phycisphaerae bacterium]